MIGVFVYIILCSFFACLLPSPPRQKKIRHNGRKVEHRDPAANCSSDDEDLAAAVGLEDGESGADINSGFSDDANDQGRDQDQAEGGRAEALEHGYIVDDFVVADSDEV